MKWLFLVHQVQTPNSRERVKVWRLIKKVGALLHRNSVYVLPYSKEHLEDFQWVCQQIRDSKGEASVFISESQDAKEDRLLRELFQSNRQRDYDALLKSAKTLLNHLKSQTDPSLISHRTFQKEISELQERLEEIRHIDFFSARVPRNLLSVLDQLKKIMETKSAQGVKTSQVKRYKRSDFRGKKWTTREHIYIDRIASAWLIRRFIDPKATFVFAAESSLPANAIPFDVFGAEFSHHGVDCTFETLLKAFHIQDRALDVIAQIIHDIDLKDHKYGRPETAGLDATIRALTHSIDDDHKLLEAGSAILDGLYHDFSPKTRAKKS